MPLTQVKVKPGARTSQVPLLHDGTYRADVRSLPTDGKANEELIRLVSRHFGYGRSQVSIRSVRPFSSSRYCRIRLSRPIGVRRAFGCVCMECDVWGCWVTPQPCQPHTLVSAGTTWWHYTATITIHLSHTRIGICLAEHTLRPDDGKR
jgi:uncharacterized protein YggU (UPF0235/DUF167 family)